MRALKLDHYTALDHMVVGEDIKPEAAAGQVLVRIAAVGVNPLDWKLLTGSMRSFMPTQFPYTPGYEASGVVEALGEGVTGFAVGDRVYGRGHRLAAQWAAMDAEQLALMPDGLSFVQAAGIPSGAQVAYSAVHEVLDLQAGQRILIHGASGGVGQFAAQLAALVGAEVWATTSSRNVERVKAAGVKNVINYSEQAFEHVVHDMDVVLNLVSDETEQRSWKVLRDGGVLLSLLRPPVVPDSAAKQKKQGAFMAGVQGNFMHLVSALVRQGRLKVALDEVFDLEHAAAAYTKSRIGHVRGKIILRVAPDLVPLER